MIAWSTLINSQVTVWEAVAFMFSHHSSTVVFLTFFAWVVPMFDKVILHLGLSLSHSWLDIKLPYPNLKRGLRPFIWLQLLEYIWCHKRARVWGNFMLNQPSYVRTHVQASFCGPNTNRLIRSKPSSYSVFLIVWLQVLSSILSPRSLFTSQQYPTGTLFWLDGPVRTGNLQDCFVTHQNCQYKVKGLMDHPVM